MSDGDFTLAKKGHLAIITLSRPEKRNALTGATLLQLQHLSESLAEDAEVRAVIIRAEGKDFSVGADISGMGDRPPQTAVLRRSAEQGARLMRAIRDSGYRDRRGSLHCNRLRLPYCSRRCSDRLWRSQAWHKLDVECSTARH